MRGGMKHLSVAAVSAMLLVFGSGGPAVAGDFTVYQHDDFGGCFYSFHGTDRDWSNNEINYMNCLGKNVNNMTSSFQNSMSRDVYLYQYVGCSGATYHAQPNSEDRDLTNNDFDNKASCLIVY